jgi:hypothetical protein
MDESFSCFAEIWESATSGWPAAFTESSSRDIAPLKARHLAVVRPGGLGGVTSPHSSGREDSPALSALQRQRLQFQHEVLARPVQFLDGLTHHQGYVGLATRWGRGAPPSGTLSQEAPCVEAATSATPACLNTRNSPWLRC